MHRISAGKDVSAGDPRNRRRLREEPEPVADGGGEGMSTASVALKAERYRPRIYGFQINEIAKLQRWQEAARYIVMLCMTYLLSQSNLAFRKYGGGECIVFNKHVALDCVWCLSYIFNEGVDISPSSTAKLWLFSFVTLFLIHSQG